MLSPKSLSDLSLTCNSTVQLGIYFYVWSESFHSTPHGDALAPTPFVDITCHFPLQCRALLVIN